MLEPGSRVDALQHLTPLVAAPIRSRSIQQLEVLEIRRVGDVRSAAEIDEGSIAVRRDDLVVVEICDALELERIVSEASVERFGAIDVLAHEGVALGDNFVHLGFKRDQGRQA